MRLDRPPSKPAVRPAGLKSVQGNPAVSRSGYLVAFSSLATNLVGDTHGIYDIFLWSRTTG